MSNIYGESIAFHPEKEDGSCHIFSPSKLQVHAPRVQFMDTVDLGARTQFTEFDDHSGNKMIETSGTKEIKCADDLTFDFNGCTAKNLVTSQLTSTASSVNFAGASINPDAVASCNPSAGYSNLNAEVDAITVTANTAKSRTEGHTVNKLLKSNGAGYIVTSNYNDDDFIRNNNTNQQELTGDLNLANGKRIKYNGVNMELSSASKLNVDLSNIGSSVVPDANIHSSITRDTEVNTATQEELDYKLDLNLSNIGNNIIPEANIHSSITRDNEVSTAMIGELSGKLNTAFSNIDSNAVLPVSNTHPDIARLANPTFSGTVKVPTGLGTSGHFLKVNGTTGAVESAQPPDTDTNTVYDNTDFVDLSSNQFSIGGTKSFNGTVNVGLTNNALNYFGTPI